MNVAIDLRVLSGDWSGIATYTTHLLKGLQTLDAPPRFTFLYQEPGAMARIKQQFPALSLSPHTHRVFPRSLYDIRGILPLRALLKEEKVDAYYTSQFFWPYGVLPVPVFSTIHDIIPLQYPEGLPHSRKSKWRCLLGLCTWFTLKTSRLVFVDSKATRDALIQYYTEQATRRCRVLYAAMPAQVPETLPEQFLLACKARFGLEAGFLLVVGRQDPYKNLVRLVQAFAAICQKGYGGKLVLAGKEDPRYPEADYMARELGIEDRVVITDFIDEKDLEALYVLADLVVQPSLFEGFGLTALEALRFGKICVASNQSALPEVLGPAALYFNPLDQGDMTQVLLQALSLSPDQKDPFHQQGRQCLVQYRPEGIASSWWQTIHESLSTSGK